MAAFIVFEKATGRIVDIQTAGATTSGADPALAPRMIDPRLPPEEQAKLGVWAVPEAFAKAHPIGEILQLAGHAAVLQAEDGTVEGLQVDSLDVVLAREREWARDMGAAHAIQKKAEEMAAAAVEMELVAEEGALDEDILHRVRDVRDKAKAEKEEALKLAKGARGQEAPLGVTVGRQRAGEVLK